MTAEGGCITGQLLKCRSGEFDLESIHTLNLAQAGISDLGCIGECSELERLDLSHNNIHKLYSLAGLVSLTQCNLNLNNIASLEGLQSLDNLEVLCVAGNNIPSVESLRCLSGLEKLKELRLMDGSSGNPVCDMPGYKAQVAAVLPHLVTLDGERLKGKGSELFKMCSELDQIIKARENQSDSMLSSRVQPWVTQDYWTKKPQLEFDSSNLHDAQQQLEDLLSECHRVTLTADQRLKTIAHDQFVFDHQALEESHTEDT